MKIRLGVVGKISVSTLEVWFSFTTFLYESRCFVRKEGVTSHVGEELSANKRVKSVVGGREEEKMSHYTLP